MTKITFAGIIKEQGEVTMANAPYAEQIKSNKITQDLVTRLYYFKQVHEITELVSILNGSKTNDEELLKAGKHIVELYDKLTTSSPEEAKHINDKFEEYPELYDIVDNMSNDSVNTSEIGYKLIELDMRRRGYSKLAKGQAESCKLSLKGMLYNILLTETKGNNKKKGNKNKEGDEFEELTDKILSGNLSKEEYDKVIPVLQMASKKVLNQMKTDWQTYENSATKDPNIESLRKEFEELLLDTRTVNYKCYPELRGVLLCIRDDCNSEEGSKKAFLKIMGNLLDAGNKVAASPGKAPQTLSNYRDFTNIIKANYPDNYEQVINNFLGCPDGAKSNDLNFEKERQKRFDAMSSDIYFKFLTSILDKKVQQSKMSNEYGVDWKQYVEFFVPKYINNLKNEGINNTTILGLSDEKGVESYQDMLIDSIENKFVSLHHDIPVAAAVPLYVELHPELHDPKITEKYIQELKEVCPEVFKDYIPNDANKKGDESNAIRSNKDMLIIGLALNAFSDEIKQEKKIDIRSMSDKKRKQYLQSIENKRKIKEIYAKHFPRDINTLNKIREEICAVVNNIGNYTIPIGNNTHRNMEPEGILNFGKDSSLFLSIASSGKKVHLNTILKCEISDTREVEKIVDMLPINYREGVKKCLANGGEARSKEISVRADLPQSSLMQKINNTLNNIKKTLVICSILKNAELDKAYK